MTRALNKLSALAVKRADAGKFSDGGGLWLYKREEGPGQWVLRYTLHGRRREMGLGSVQQVTLKDAREAADGWRAMVAKSLDPINEGGRKRKRSENRLHLLADVAIDAFESRRPS